MNLHKHQLYLLEQHSNSFNSWSAVIRIQSEGKHLIIKYSPLSYVRYVLPRGVNSRMTTVLYVLYYLPIWYPLSTRTHGGHVNDEDNDIPCSQSKYQISN